MQLFLFTSENVSTTELKIAYMACIICPLDSSAAKQEVQGTSWAFAGPFSKTAPPAAVTQKSRPSLLVTFTGSRGGGRKQTHVLWCWEGHSFAGLSLPREGFALWRCSMCFSKYSDGWIQPESKHFKAFGRRSLERGFQAIRPTDDVYFLWHKSQVKFYFIAVTFMSWE